MNQYLPQITAAFAAAAILVKAYALPVGAYLALQIFASLVSLAFARKTQVETWVASHPRATFILRIVRAFGVDPWLLAKAWKGLADSRPPTGVPSGLVRLVYRVRAWLGLLAFALLLVRCQPAKAPTANEAATAAINLTDIALSEAMAVANPGPH